MTHSDAGHLSMIGDSQQDNNGGRLDAIAGAVDGVANRLEESADAMKNGRLARVTRGTANALDSTASYVREFEPKAALKDITEVMKKHPQIAIASAVVLGVLLGRTMTRNNS